MVSPYLPAIRALAPVALGACLAVMFALALIALRGPR